MTLRDSHPADAIEGYLESYDGGMVIGWVWRPADPTARLVVEILRDGTPVAWAPAASYRQDVEEAGRGDGGYGFQIPVAGFVGQTLGALIANFQTPLSGQVVISPESGAARKLQGQVDSVSGLSIAGWCWSPVDRDLSVTIEAWLDGQVVATTIADRFRGDLAESGIGSGAHVFQLKLPLWMADGTMRTVTVAAQGGGWQSDPIDIAAFPGGPLHLLDAVAQALPADAAAARSAARLLRACFSQAELLSPASIAWAEYPAWHAAFAPAAFDGQATFENHIATSIGEGENQAIALLDAGAAMLPGALERAYQIFCAARADILYGDAELATAAGAFPWFRPDWSYDLFLAQDYTSGLMLVRPSLFGGPQQFSSLAAAKIAAVEAATASRIHHVPEVLARLHQPSDGDAWLAAVRQHLQRRGRGDRVERLPLGGGDCRRVRWAVPVPAPSISLIIPTRDKLDLLSACIDSIRRITDYANYEIIVVNNQSAEAATLAYLRQGAASGWFRVVDYDKPFNYSEMNNVAARAAHGAALGFINNDVELISPEWLQEAGGLLARSDVGAVGAKLRFANGMIQHAGVVLGIGGLAENAFQQCHVDDEGYFQRTQVAGDYSAVTAACLFCRTEVFNAVGGFDAANLPVAFNDVDFCLRLRERGYRIVWTPHIELFHHESASRGRDLSPDRRARAFKEEAYMRRRWGGILAHDPFYNPNLNLDGWPFSGLALPPRRRVSLERR